MYVFNRENKVLQKERAALNGDVQVYDYLKDEVGYRLSDRVFDIKRKFNTIVDLGKSFSVGICANFTYIPNFNFQYREKMMND